MPGVLSGTKVLDLTHYISGPFCTELLSEFGAEVVKVERPGTGEPARHIGPFFHDEPGIERSGLFMLLNNGKKSITLDLKTEEGQKIFRELCQWADIVVENFSYGVMDRLGLGYDKLVRTKPDLIMTSISNFGQTGPYRQFHATEMILLALSGVMYLTGPFEKPVKYGLYQLQYVAGVEAASATIAAYFASMSEKGKGDHIDAAIVEALKNYVNNHGSYYSYMGAIRGRLAKVPDMIDMIVPTRDGYIAPVFFGYVNWEDFCTMLEAPELNQPEFTDAASRRANRKALLEILTKKFATFNKLELCTLAQEWRFSFGVVQTPEDILQSPQLIDRDFFVEIEHPVTGPLRYCGVPFKMSGSPMQIQGRAPLLGEHNAAVYGQILGYSAEELKQLREQRVI